jgi:hypothetical protein
VRSVGFSESSFQLCQILVGKGWVRREDDGVVAAVLGGFGDGWWKGFAVLRRKVSFDFGW